MNKEQAPNQKSEVFEREKIKISLRNLFDVAQSADSEKFKNNLLDFIENEMKDAQLSFEDIGITKEEFKESSGRKASPEK